MKRLKFLAALFLMSASLSFTGCNDDDNTIALPWLGTAEDAIPATILEAIQKSGMDIYEGVCPPNIEGQYRIDNPELFWANHEEAVERPTDIFIAYYDQDGNTCKYAERFNINSNDIGNNIEDVTVIGNGENFTAYCKVNHNFVAGNYDAHVVISGTKNECAISNIQYAIILTAKSDPYHQVMDVTDVRIYKDGNGSADEYPWR